MANYVATSFWTIAEYAVKGAAGREKVPWNNKLSSFGELQVFRDYHSMPNILSKSKSFPNF